MTYRSILLLAAGLTGFVIVVVAGLGFLFAQTPPPAPAAAPADPPTAAPVAVLDAAGLVALQQQAAYAQATVVAQPTPVPPTAVPPPTAAAPVYPITADAAGRIARAAHPTAALARPPALVSYQGTVAYEVALDAGMVYVDATTGRIVYDGVAAQAGPAPNPRRRENEQSSGGGDN